MELRTLFKNLPVILCMLVLEPQADAQNLYSKNSSITVSPNTSLSILGNVENEGTIVNNGRLKVSGAWVNSGQYYPGEGEVVFDSSSPTVPQIIHHNGQTINRLTISGGTKKIIVSDMVIGRAVQFDDGVMETSGNSSIFFEPDIVIKGASDQSHVHGVIYQKGSGQKLFPLGNGFTYLPVELENVTDSSAIVGVEGFEASDLVHAKQTSLQSISGKRYWHINVVSGSVIHSKVVLPLRDESSSIDPEDVVVVQSSSPTETFSSIGRSSFEGQANNGRVTSGSIFSLPFVSLGMNAAGEEVIVYNAVSANSDGLNDFLRIENIEHYPGNKFMVFNRWGDKIFEVADYDNQIRSFRGRSNIYGDASLPSGSYFYVLDLPGRASLRGFIAVKN